LGGVQIAERDIMAFLMNGLALATIVSSPFAWPAAAADLPDFAGRIAAGTIAAISDGDFVAQRATPPAVSRRALPAMAIS
jgi:hypothetical protein